MFDKVVLAMVAVVAIMLVPEFAWASAAGDVKQVNSALDLIKDHLKDFAWAWLAPQTDSIPNMVLSIAAIVLSTIGILVLQPIRKLASRAGGFPVALMLAGLIIPLGWKLVSFGLGKIPWWGLVLLAIGLILGGLGGLVSIVKSIVGIYKKLFDHAIGVAKKEDAGWGFAVAGSIFLMSWINSSSISTAEIWYLPSWFCLLVGAGMIISRIRGTGKYKDSAEIRDIRRKLKGHENCIVIPDNTPDNPYDNQVLCIAKHYAKYKNGDFKLNSDGSKKQVECNTVNSQDHQICRKCETPFNNIPWKCPKCNADNTPDRRICHKADCQEPKPIPKRPESCTSIVPKDYVAPDDPGSDPDQGVDIVKCPHCDAENSEGYKFCGKCRKPPQSSPKPEPDPEDYDFSGGGYDPDDLDDD
jgi:hypothetical protein